MTWTDEDMADLRRCTPVYYTGPAPKPDVCTRAADEIERLRAKVAELEAERATIFTCCGMAPDDSAEDVVELIEDLRSDARHFERRCAELEANAIPRDELVRALRERAATYASGTTNPSPAALRSMERGAMECEHLANVIEARAFTPKDGKS